jgi:transcriptional regulator with XRE-family HTH domain
MGPEVNAMNFLEKLDMLMEEKGINKSRLSRGSGVPYTTIASFYEKGYRNIRLATLKKLSSYFGCSIDYLTAESDDQVVTPEDMSRLLPSEIDLVNKYRTAKRSRKTIVENLLKATAILLDMKETGPDDQPVQIEMPEELFQ